MMRNIVAPGRLRLTVKKGSVSMDFRQEFIEFALAQNVLRFGEFKTKAKTFPLFLQRRSVQRRRGTRPSVAILRQGHPGQRYPGRHAVWPCLQRNFLLFR